MSHWAHVAPKGGQVPPDLLVESPAEHLHSANVRAESMLDNFCTRRGAKRALNHVVVCK